MTSAAPTLTDAIALAQAGHKTEAYHLLKMLVQSRSTDPTVLLWLAFTTPDLDEAERVIIAIGVIEPGNINLPAAHNWLAQERQKRPAFAPPPVPPFTAAAPADERVPAAPTKRAPTGNQSGREAVAAGTPQPRKRRGRMTYRAKGIAETREFFALCAVILALLVSILPSLVFSMGIAALIGLIIAAVVRLVLGWRAGESLEWGILELVIIAACIFGPIYGIFWFFMDMARNDPHFLVPNFHFPTPTARPGT